jgi:hypothetical protein
MWRNERQRKINDLLVACQASVDNYEHVAALVESPALAEWLRAVARYREHLVPLFEEQVRELKDLPRVPDPERQLLEHALARFKAAMPTGDPNQVLDERFQTDQEMLALAKSAREEALPKGALSLLEEFITHLEITLGALAGS